MDDKTQIQVAKIFVGGLITVCTYNVYKSVRQMRKNRKKLENLVLAADLVEQLLEWAIEETIDHLDPEEFLRIWNDRIKFLSIVAM